MESATTVQATSTTVVNTGSASPSVPTVERTTINTTPLTPMANGTASPSTVACVASRTCAGTA